MDECRLAKEQALHGHFHAVFIRCHFNTKYYARQQSKLLISTDLIITQLKGYTFASVNFCFTVLRYLWPSTDQQAKRNYFQLFHSFIHSFSC